MVMSKKKMRKQVKADEDQLQEDLEANYARKDKEEREAKIAKKMLNDTLFTSNTGKGINLKGKREQLKKDRFKEIEIATTPKGESVLGRRLLKKADNNIAPRKKVKPTNRTFNEEEEFGGELMDIWAEAAPIKSKKFDRYKNGYAKKEHVKVKQVIVPTGGQSYNPSANSHKKLLKDVAKKEEQIIEKNLNDLKLVRPLMFEEVPEIDESNPAKEEESSEYEDSSDEEIDLSKPLSFGKKVDRLKIKTTSDRNRIWASKAKLRVLEDKRIGFQNEKDFARLENLIKQSENVGKMQKNRNDKIHKEIKQENDKQENTGVVEKPKKIGRFKYSQRKLDYQLEDELSGNLRQLKPYGGDHLLQDRYDSIFRRNIIEMDAPTNNEKKRQKKAKFKTISRIENKTKDLHDANQALKKKNDETQRGLKKFKQNRDVIMI